MKRIKAIGYSLSCLTASVIWGTRNKTVCTAVFMKAWSGGHVDFVAYKVRRRYRKVENILDWLASPMESNHCQRSYQRWLKHTGVVK
jgi:hypothetical protein